MGVSGWQGKGGRLPAHVIQKTLLRVWMDRQSGVACSGRVLRQPRPQGLVDGKPAECVGVPEGFLVDGADQTVQGLRTAVRREGWTSAEIDQMDEDRVTEAEWQENLGDRMLTAFERGQE